MTEMKLVSDKVQTLEHSWLLAGPPEEFMRVLGVAVTVQKRMLIDASKFQAGKVISLV